MIVCDDVLHWAETYDGLPFHALLCDPPYHLTEITSMQRHGSLRFGESRTDEEKAYRRQDARGFMGQRWDGVGADGQGIAFRPATWKALAAHLLPGAWGACFASARGWHRLACAIEDAGLIIQPSVFLWLYASGFPKATRIPDERFEGHRYGGQVLKPAAEPLIMWQKPFSGSPRACITQTGAGALWVDGTRVPAAGETPAGSGHRESWREMEGREDRQPWNGGNVTPAAGRWPPNFVMTHSHLPDAPCTPAQCPVAALDAQAGERASGGQVRHTGTAPKTTAIWGHYDHGSSVEYHDGGNASRFFPTFGWADDVAERLAAAVPVHYAAKASRRERDAGLEHYPSVYRDTAVSRATQVQGLEGTNGRGSHSGPGHNPHPTVKPLSLLTWLSQLLLPPAAYAPRRLLVPFAGSGSECISARLAGWEEVVGVEQDAAYVALAEARLAHWLGLCAGGTEGKRC